MQTESQITPNPAPPPPEPKRFALVLNRANLLIASLVKKVEPQRYVLAALHITPKHTEVTDGHIAVRVSLPEIGIEQMPRFNEGDTEPFTLSERDGFKPFTITANDALEVEKNLPKEKSLTILNHAQVEVGANGQAKFLTSALDRDDQDKLIAPVLVAEKGVSAYPQIDKILSKKRIKLEVKVDAELLVSVLKAAIEVKRHEDKKAKAYVALRFRDNRTLFEVECNNTTTGQHFLGIVMPIHPDGTV